jgi:hypothetical protein
MSNVDANGSATQVQDPSLWRSEIPWLGGLRGHSGLQLLRIHGTSLQAKSNRQQTLFIDVS